tara:strand:+ start:228 stop:680 length:453 start_codon:yes stop_codon:yes gene_type:complete
MEITVKTFQELKLNELYDLLRLRAEVFVVEQDCIYQDIDGKDQKAIHVLGTSEGKLIAYTRCFSPGSYFEEAAIGRVVVSKNFRNQDFGYQIMEASIQAVEEIYKTSTIKISAQEYLSRFYESLGFQPTGKEYLEDGIPHIEMIKKQSFS